MRVGPGLRSAAMIAIFDIGGPLVTYAVLRSAGRGAVTSLVVSGVFPALGVAIGIIAHRRADAIGILVLAGIAVGTVLGLIAHSARLVLLEGSVPTGVFGLICLGSLWRRRPLMFRFALEFMGPDTPKGREFDGLWQYEEFRRAFRNLTVVWGLAYLMEAAARIVIVERTSTGVALAVSKVMPLAVTAVLALWTVAYSKYQKRKGERLATTMATSEVPSAGPDD
jgi:intracellular septation protein A